MKKTISFLALFLLFGIVSDASWADSDFSFTSSPDDNKWVPPPPVDDNDRVLKYDIQAAFQHDADLQDQAFSMFDLSAKRQLDDNSVFAEGLLRFRKALSTTDSAGEIDLRLARVCYLEPWLQVTVGRFELFQNLSSNLFFGAYPIMGIHRVDGVLATLPFSFFFNLGPAKEGQAENSSPLALSFFYTPSLFSAQQVQYDNTQTFWLTQLKFKIEEKDFTSTFRANFGGSASDFFDYSSLNGGNTFSVSADMVFNQNNLLTAEYGVQNISHYSETGVLSAGFQASRLGTWGAFSLDQIALESQLPLGSSLADPFTGGNGLNQALAQSAQASWYVKIRTRLKVLFIELHVTNNQNDFTMARPAPGALAVPFTGNFGPGNETDGPGTTLRSAGYSQLAFLLRTGVEF